MILKKSIFFFKNKNFKNLIYNNLKLLIIKLFILNIYSDFNVIKYLHQKKKHYYLH